MAIEIKELRIKVSVMENPDEHFNAAQKISPLKLQEMKSEIIRECTQKVLEKIKEIIQTIILIIIFLINVLVFFNILTSLFFKLLILHKLYHIKTYKPIGKNLFQFCFKNKSVFTWIFTYIFFKPFWKINY